MIFTPLAQRLAKSLQIGKGKEEVPEPFSKYGGLRGAVRVAISQGRAIEFAYRGLPGGDSPPGFRRAFPAAIFVPKGTGRPLMAAWVVPPSRSSSIVPGWRTFALRGVSSGLVLPKGPTPPRIRPSLAYWRTRGRLIVP